MARRVHLYGYFGQGNLGDEALREVWSAALAPGFQVLPCSPPRLPWGSGPWLFCGGLLQDRTSFRSLAFYAAAIRLATSWGPVGLVSIGVELRRAGSQRLVRAALARAGYLSARDEPSRRALESLGLAPKLFPDPVLSLPPPRPHRGGPLLVNLVTSLPPGLRRRALRTALSLGAALGAPVKGLLMSPEDALALAGLESLRPTATAQALQLISAAPLVLAARLHALELALVAGTPFVALTYAEKVEGFLGLVERELAAPVPRDPGEAGLALASGFRRGLLRARDRLRAEAKEGIADVKRWLAQVA